MKYCTLAKVFLLPQLCSNLKMCQYFVSNGRQRPAGEPQESRTVKYQASKEGNTSTSATQQKIYHCCCQECQEFPSLFGTLWFNGPNFVFPVQPPPQKLLPEHAQTLERYAWESFDPHSQGKCIFISTTPPPIQNKET